MGNLRPRSIQKSDFRAKKSRGSPKGFSLLGKWAKFSSLGIQWVVVLLIAAWVGQKFDQWIDTSRPYFTALSSLLALIGVFCSLMRSLSGIENDEKEQDQ